MQKIKKMTGCEYVKILPRCNSAILISMSVLKKMGYKEICIQDQGGWNTYKTLPLVFDLKINELKTDYGIIRDCKSILHPASHGE